MFILVGNGVRGEVYKDVRLFVVREVCIDMGFSYRVFCVFFFRVVRVYD